MKQYLKIPGPGHPTSVQTFMLGSVTLEHEGVTLASAMLPPSPDIFFVYKVC